MDKDTIVITFGTFDLFHLGHLRIIQAAAKLGTNLVVGVSSDALNCTKKGKNPTIPENHRMEIVGNIKGVDKVFLEESLEQKKEYCQLYNAQILVMGDDHKDEYDDMLRGVCKCVYPPRTQHISTTDLIVNIKSST